VCQWEPPHTHLQPQSPPSPRGSAPPGAPGVPGTMRPVLGRTPAERRQGPQRPWGEGARPSSLVLEQGVMEAGEGRRGVGMPREESEWDSVQVEEGEEGGEEGGKGRGGECRGLGAAAPGGCPSSAVRPYPGIYLSKLRGTCQG